MRRIAFVVVGFLALAGLIGYAATNAGTGQDDEGSGEGGGVVGSAPATGGVESDGRDVAVGTSGGVAVDDLGAPSLESGGSVAELAGLPAIGPSVVRTATIGLEVKDGGFGQAFDAASLVAGKYGGYVQSSSTAGTKVRSGELLIRVPSDSFDEAMADLRRLGTVQSQSLSGEDVTSQFIDLDARLLTWEAQEAVLLDLMGQATSIEATLRVQRELQDVQFRIEEIKGQLQVLQNRADLATIQVSIREAGAVVEPAGASKRPSLAEAWERAVDGFLGVCYSVVVGLGYLVPISIIAGLAWLGFRRVSSGRVPPRSIGS